MNIKKLFLTILALSIACIVNAQVIKGSVKDIEGKPLPGVSVIISGTTTGTTTDQSGSYSIRIQNPINDVLEFSLIGTKTAFEKVAKRKTINVTLIDDVNYLDEVVVVGYQEVKRKELLGSVSSVSSEKILEQPVATVGQALAGRMAGVSVITTEGDADAKIKINVRGTASITQSSEPLYIVDGFPVSDISDLAASQIKNIDVLKDAFATAIYGSRGANGVVIVTTKDALGLNKVSISLNAYYGWKQMANKDAYKMQSASEFVKSQYEYNLLTNNGSLTKSYMSYFGTFQDIGLYDNVAGNDYMEMLFGNIGTNYNVDLTVSGKSDRNRWTLTIARLGEKGIMTGSYFGRTNLGFKSNLRTGKNTSLDINVRFADTDTRGGSANNMNDLKFSSMNGRVNQALLNAPIPVHNNVYGEDDDITFSQYRINALKSAEDNDQQTNRINLNFNGAFNWYIIDNLRLRLDFGYSLNTTDRDNFIGSSTYWSNMYSNYKTQPANRHQEYRNNIFRNSNTINYDFKKILDPKRHKLNFVLGQELNIRSTKTEELIIEGFPDFFKAEDAWNFSSSGVPYSSNIEFAQKDVLLSFFGRANYTLLSRYSFGVTLRADGSSRFGSGHKWGIFPSAAVSWNIMGEKWMKKARWIDQLKLRYSYGTAGNNNVPPGQIYQVYSSRSTENRMADISSVWQPSSNLPNESLTWETAITQNLGLDFSFFKSRINGSVEIYDNRTKNLIIQFPVSGTGYSKQYQNRASIMNRGVELSLDIPIIHKRNFDLNISANAAYNYNKVLSIGGLDNIKSYTGWASTHISYDYMVTAGEPLGNVYGYEYNGVYQVDDFIFNGSSWVLKENIVSDKDIIGDKYFRPGSTKLKDQNGDGIINEKDMIKIGNTLPKVTGGFAINCYLYGVDLSANFNFTAGNQVYNANRCAVINTIGTSYINLSDDVGLAHRWTSVNWTTGKQFTDAAAYAEANANATEPSPMSQNAFLTNREIENGSFLRLQSLTIGYTLPAKVLARIHMSKLRFYITGSNLFCLTKYSGYDPEVDCRRSTPLTPGCDFSAYPKSRGVVVGVNINF